MAKIIVLGAGLVGMSTALLLARDGHEVTVLERDSAPPPDLPTMAWDGWQRPGVSQFRQAQFLLPRWHAEMRLELPDVLDELAAAGGYRTNSVGMLPPELTGGVRPDDDRFDIITARRPVAEAAVAAVVARTPGIRVLRGVSVTGLIAGPERVTGVPRVVGVLAHDVALRADLVVDATGRRSAVPTLVQAIGGRRPVESRAESRFAYYARHFRSATAGDRPAATATLLSHFDSVSVLTLPCDNDTWVVNIVASSGDKDARALRDERTWQRVMTLFPHQAPWTTGVPLTGVQVFAGVEDRCRSYMVDGTPVATGLIAVGDAWACTNPSLGRGASFGILHARILRDVLRECAGDDPDQIVQVFDEATRLQLKPLFDATVAVTRHRLAEIEANIAGERYRTEDIGWTMGNALHGAAFRDPDLLRAYLSIAAMIATPEQALAAPGLIPKVMSLSANAPRYFLPGPSRAELLAALTADVPVYA
jgi:2-polyprenyl-6-methoxyphenol hydroxylase-like FAD-dependent oxidoreductase